MSKTIISKNECKNQHKETSLHYLSFLSVERNFEKYPLWSVVPKWGTTFTSSKIIELEPHTFPDGRVVQRRVKIIPHAELGYITVKTQEIWYALLHLWWQLSEEERKTGIIEFSRRELIVRILGKQFGKDQVKALEKAIKQLAGNLLHFEYLFYDREKDELLKEVEGFTMLTRYHFTRKDTQSDIVHDKCTVTLNPVVVSNLLAGYCKPVIPSVILSIKSDIARLLYSKLDTQFSHYRKYEISTERFFREHGLEASEYKYPSSRKRLLEKAIKELTGKPTSSGAVIERYEFLRTADKKDWKLLTYSDGKAEKKDNVINLKKTKQASQKQKKKSSPQPQKLSPEIEELLAFFDTTFHGGKRTSRTKPIIQTASSVINDHGLLKGKYFVRYAFAQAQKTSYEPSTFNGISQYLQEALEEHARQERINKRQKEEVRKRNEENTKADHKKEYEGEYYDYVLSLMELFSYKFPQELITFEKEEALKEEGFKKGVEAASSKTTRWLAKKQLDIFYRKEQKAIRFREFFEGHKTVHVPDFWQWDKEINPNSLSSSSQRSASS